MEEILGFLKSIQSPFEDFRLSWEPISLEMTIAVTCFLADLDHQPKSLVQSCLVRRALSSRVVGIGFGVIVYVYLSTSNRVKHTSHRVKHTNFLFGTQIHLCSSYMWCRTARGTCPTGQTNNSGQ